MAFRLLTNRHVYPPPEILTAGLAQACASDLGPSGIEGHCTWPYTPPPVTVFLIVSEEPQGAGVHTACDTCPRSIQHVPNKTTRAGNPLSFSSLFVPGTQSVSPDLSHSRPVCLIPTATSHPVPSSFLAEIRMHLTTTVSLDWAEFSRREVAFASLTWGHYQTQATSHSLPCLRLLGYPGFGCKSVGVLAYGSDSLVGLSSPWSTQCQGQDTYLLPFVHGGFLSCWLLNRLVLPLCGVSYGTPHLGNLFFLNGIYNRTYLTGDGV